MKDCIKITKAWRQTLRREEDYSMKIARYLSLLIAMLLCLAFVPASAETMHVATSNVLPDMLVGIDDEELFVGFAEQKFYGYERMNFGLARENLDAK